MAEKIVLELEGKIAGFKSAMDEAQKSTENVRSALGAVQRIGTAAFAGIAVGVGLAVRQFSKFDNELRGVKTLLDETSFAGKTLDKGFKQLKKDILGVAKVAPVGIGSLNKALFDTISAGIDASEAVKTVGVAAQLAVAGLTDVSTATDGLTSALNAYGLSADDAQSVSAKFFTTQKLGKTTISELSNSFGVVGANAEAAGVGINELLGAVSAITLGGVSTSSAFRGLKAAISNVSKPSADAAKEAKRLGIEFTASSLRAKGLKGFLDELTKSQDFNKDSVAKLFGSTEAQGVIFALTGNQAGKFSEAVEKLGDEQKIASTFTKAYNEQLGSFENQTKLLTNNISALSIQLGEHFAPALLTVNKALTKMVKLISSDDEIVKTTAVVIGITAAFSGMIAVVASVILGVIALQAAALALGVTLSAVLVGAAAIVTALGTLASVVFIVADNWEEGSKRAQAAIETLIEFTKNAFYSLGGVLTAVMDGDFVGTLVALEKFIDTFSDSLNSFKEKLKEEPFVLPLIVRDENGEKFEIDRIFDEFRADALGQKPLEIPFREGERGNDGIAEAEKEAARSNEIEAQNLHNQKLLEQQAAHNKKVDEQKADDNARKAALKAELDELGLIESDLGNAKEIETLQNQTQIKGEMKEEFNRKQLKENRTKNKKVFEDEQKHGVVIAKLNQFTNSAQLQGASRAANELVQLQNSKNKKQKAIGKASARSQAAIATALGAIQVFTSLSSIPIFGSVLGAIAAASLVAYGVEKQQQISAANSGGFIPNLNGGSSFGDSQLTATTPGEFVVPANNARNVIDAAASAQNEAASLEDGGGSGGGGAMEVVIGFSDNAFDIIEEKLLERRALNTGVL